MAMFVLESVGSHSQHFPEFRPDDHLYYVPGSPELRWPLNGTKSVKDWPRYVCVIRTADGPLPDLPSLSVEWIVVSMRLANLLLRHADDVFETFPIAICDLFGKVESRKYVALNCPKPLAALDASKSVLDVAQKDPRGKQARRRIVVRSEKIRRHEVFFLKRLNLIIVSDRVRNAIEAASLIGCHFSEVEVA